MLWSMERLSESKVVTIWQNQVESSSAMLVGMSGRNRMEQEDQANVQNVEAQTSIGPLRIEDMLELEGAADNGLSSEDILGNR